MFKKIIFFTAACLTLCQCSPLRSDCEAIAKREAEIAQEAPGDYYIGRRYYIPYTRFWGYVRKPGFLFYPSERYSEKMLTLQPKFMPTPQQCAGAR